MTERRRQARGTARMNQILDAADRLLPATGYERLTTNAIAAEAGISPGSLYQFFSDKQDVVSVLIQRHASALLATVPDALGMRRLGRCRWRLWSTGSSIRSWRSTWRIRGSRPCSRARTCLPT